MEFAARTHATSGATHRWRSVLLALAALIGAILFLYRDTAVAMEAIWSRSDTFAHAYLVLPIVAWLMWQKRDELAALSPQPCGWFLLPMALAAFAWLLADVAAVNALAQFALVTLLVLSAPLVLGPPVARVIAFPLAFAYFLVPVGEFLLPWLMEWTADFTIFALRASTIPVFREGNHFVIPSGNWSVVEACSGVRYLIASFMVGTLYAYLNYRSLRRRLIFIGISIAVPIVANWIRAYMIVMIGHLSSNRYATGADHLVYGWVFFAVVIALLYAIGTIWSERDADGSVTVQAPSQGAADSNPLAPFALAAAAVLIVAGPLVASHRLQTTDDTATPVQLSQLAPSGGGWSLRSDPITTWHPAFQHPSAQTEATFSSEGKQVGVYIGYYRAQGYARKLVSSSNELVRSLDRDWALISSDGKQEVALPGSRVWLRVSAVGGGGAGSLRQRLAVWQVYWAGDRLTASDSLAKVYSTFHRLTGRGDDSAVILFYSIEDQPGDASATLERFVRSNLQGVVDHLRRARDGTPAAVVVGTADVKESR
jgi:exosortase A